MDFYTSRRHLPLSVAALTLLLGAGCTQAVSATIRVECPDATVDLVAQTFELLGWIHSESVSKGGAVHRNLNYPSCYLQIMVEGKGKIVILFIGVARTRFEKREIEAYRELVSSLIGRFETGVQFDAETSTGQVLK